MSHKSKRVRGKLGGHLEPLDPLQEIESEENLEASGKIHNLSEKPTKPLKRARNKKESYRHFRGR